MFKTPYTAGGMGSAVIGGTRMPRVPLGVVKNKSIKWITNKDLLYVTEQPGCEGSLGRMDMCMSESLCCSSETTITTLFVGYTLIQNEKFKKETGKFLKYINKG